MIDFLQGAGFLGGNGTLGADISLVVSVLAAVLFTIGWRLAVRKRFEAHRWVQTAAACLNAVLVLAWMIRSFVVYILPGIPGQLRSAAPTRSRRSMPSSGCSAWCWGCSWCCAATSSCPAALRFTNYKPFMRWSYVLYMLGTLTGVIVYYVVYVGG